MDTSLGWGSPWDSESSSDDDVVVIRRRKKVVKRKLLSWTPHMEQLLQECQFRRYYRMDASSFDKLLGKIAHSLQINRQNSNITLIFSVNMCRMLILPLLTKRHMC